MSHSVFLRHLPQDRGRALPVGLEGTRHLETILAHVGPSRISRIVRVHEGPFLFLGLQRCDRPPFLANALKHRTSGAPLLVPELTLSSPDTPDAVVTGGPRASVPLPPTLNKTKAPIPRYHWRRVKWHQGRPLRGALCGFSAGPFFVRERSRRLQALVPSTLDDPPALAPVSSDDAPGAWPCSRMTRSTVAHRIGPNLSERPNKRGRLPTTAPWRT